MSILKIKDLTEQIRGVSYKPSDVVTSDIGLPILRANNIKDNSLSFDDLVFIKPEKVSKKQLLQNGDIVICASSGSKELVGKAGVFCNNDTYSFGAFCKAVRVKRIDGIDSDYVRLYFSSKYYRECIALSSKGSNINNIKTENIEELNINIPSIEEQNTAVSLLNALISAIDNKKQELFSLDELVKSRFIEMFGDIVRNDKSWTTEIITKVCPIKQYDGKITECDGKIWLLNLDLVESNTGVILDKYYVAKTEIGNSTITFSEGNVLYSKLRPYLNKVVVPDGNGYATSELIPFFPLSQVNKYYLAYALRSESFVTLINSKAGGAKMPRAPMDFIRSFPLPVPPIELQNEFAEFVKLIDKSKFIVQQQIKDLQELLDSKMDEYFR